MRWRESRVREMGKRVKGERQKEENKGKGGEKKRRGEKEYEHINLGIVVLV